LCCAKSVYNAPMKLKRQTFIEESDRVSPYDPDAEPADLWFLPDAEEEEGHLLPGGLQAVPRALIDAPTWRAAEGALAADLADLAFDVGRLAERVSMVGPGAVQRLAQAEAASLSWWTGDRISTDRLALWLSYRIGAAEEDGGGLIRTAWAARRLTAKGQGADLAALLAGSLGEEGRHDDALITDAVVALEALADLSPITRGCALNQLWRSLDERPDHLRGLEAAVLGARLAAGQAGGRGGSGSLPFLPLTLTGFTALTATGAPDRRLSGWIAGAHRAVLSALMTLERVATWQARAEAETTDLSGRTPARLIAALAAHPMLAAPQAEAETGASRAAVQRNLDVLVARGLVREVTGQGRFRVWAAVA
jgi:hypothetical protein